MDKFYKEANLDIKQKLVGLIFTEKLIFANSQLQTPKMNAIVSLIMLGSKELAATKKGQKKNFFSSVPCGEPAGIQTPSLLIRSQMLYSVKLQALLMSRILDCKCKE